MTKSIFIGICAHNEEQDLPKTIAAIRRAMSDSKRPYKILVHDDGSTDMTRSIAIEKADYVSSTDDRRGLAHAFRTNLAACLSRGADIFVHIDADGQYPADKIPALVQEIENGHDLALGSRFLIKNGYRNAAHKALGNALFSRGYALFLSAPITDLTSGFRAMTKELGAAIAIRSNFTYTYDQYIQAVLGKYRIKEIPIQGSPTRKSRLMKNGWHYMRMAAADIWNHYPAWKRAAADSLKLRS